MRHEDCGGEPQLRHRNARSAATYGDRLLCLFNSLRNSVNWLYFMMQPDIPWPQLLRSFVQVWLCITSSTRKKPTDVSKIFTVQTPYSCYQWMKLMMDPWKTMCSLMICVPQRLCSLCECVIYCNDALELVCMCFFTCDSTTFVTSLKLWSYQFSHSNSEYAYRDSVCDLSYWEIAQESDCPCSWLSAFRNEIAV